MGLRTKGKKVIYGLFGQRKESSGPKSDRTTISPPRIVVQGEPSTAAETPRNTAGATGKGNDVSNDTARGKPTSVLRYDTPGVAGGEYEAHHLAPDVNMNRPTNFFANASHLAFMNPHMVDQSTNFMIQVANDREVKAKEHLSKHMIPGAAHNSFSREPPPRCHPGTRIKIKGGILVWFYDKQEQEFVLWIHGPAGVGKSAIVRTIADELAKDKCLGASVFFSRPNGRNDSGAVFITIAYQLAVHIKPYCTFIGEKLASDPQLVNGDMKEQFNAFIVEPFVEGKVGAGGKSWGILLDGLDELDDQRWQREIIILITTFVSEHPDAPLVWIIASRPEPHITTTFKRQQPLSTFREEYVPIDSPEACQDVEHFLRDGFKTMHDHLPYIVPQDWPEEIKFAQLAHAASGLFAFADVAIRYIGKHADPVTRLDDVLSVIEGSRVSSPDDQPFAHLDAMYTRILSSIPPETWPTTRRVLGALLQEHDMFCNAKGISVILCLRLRQVYISINDLFSVLDIPVDDVYSDIDFHHASFSDFLGDATRSKEFCIPFEETERDLEECGLRIWQDFKTVSRQGPSSEYRSRWFEYASQFHSDTDQSPAQSYDFNDVLFQDIHIYLSSSLWRWLKVAEEEALPHQWDKFFGILCQLDAASACHGMVDADLVILWFQIWNKYPEELTSRGIACEIRLKQLQLNDLEWPNEYPTLFLSTSPDSPLDMAYIRKGHSSPRSPAEFDECIAALKYFQQHNPEHQVLVCGTQRSRFAVFIYKHEEDGFKGHPFDMVEADPGHDEHNRYGYYCIPYLQNI